MDYQLKRVILIFYDTESDSIQKYFDPTNYIPYFITDYSENELAIRCSEVNFIIPPKEKIIKHDKIFNKRKEYLKLYRLNGKQRKNENDIVNILDNLQNNDVHTFEDNIYEGESYVFDHGLIFGMPYELKRCKKDIFSIKKCECGSDKFIGYYGTSKKDNSEENKKIYLFSKICNVCDKTIFEHEIEENDREYEWEVIENFSIIKKEKNILFPVLVESKIPEKITNKINEVFSNEIKEERDLLPSWNPLLFTEIPFMRRNAMDIEVLPFSRNRVPSPEKANQPVISVSFVDNCGLKLDLVLKDGYKEKGEWIDEIPDDLQIIEFKNESDLLKKTFEIIDDSPFLITFNGDKFDLLYLHNRAIKLGGFTSKKDRSNKKKYKYNKKTKNWERKNGEPLGYEIPITIGSRMAPIGNMRERAAVCNLYNGIHVDLYWFFLNPSIKTYAFGNAYEKNGLDDITKALLKKHKVSSDILSDSGEKKWISDYSKYELIYYNYIDSEITLELTQYDDNLVWNLMFMIMRIAKVGIEEMVRHQIGHWIKILFYWIHRQNEYLIPRKELINMFANRSSQSIIKGKGFEGAFVPHPIPGVFFDVTAMDFASLYPTMVKIHNLSYETVDICEHEKCQLNRVPEVGHWICQERVGIFALVIGLIRDYRVKYFKYYSKENHLDELINLLDGNVELAKSQRILYKVVEQVLKVFINASFGVEGNRFFAFYHIGVAESITAYGRNAIKSLMDEASKILPPPKIYDYNGKLLEEIMVIDKDGNRIKKKITCVLNGDTDSTFLYQPNSEQIKYLMNWSNNNLGVELGVDYELRFMANSDRKKNYVAIFKNDSKNPLLKGVTGKKSNTPLFIKEEFKFLINYLKDNLKEEKDLDKTKSFMIKFAKKIVKNIDNGKYPAEKMIFKQQLKKDPIDGYTSSEPQHVKAARMAMGKKNNKDQIKLVSDEDEKNYIDIEAGDYIEYLKTDDSKGVMAFNLYQEDRDRKKISKEKYKEVLGNVFNQVYECFAINWKTNILSTNKNIDSWF